MSSRLDVVERRDCAPSFLDAILRECVPLVLPVPEVDP